MLVLAAVLLPCFREGAWTPEGRRAVWVPDGEPPFRVMYSAKLKTRKEWKRTVPGILGLLYDKGVTGGQHGGN